MAATFDEAELLGRVDNDLEFLAETVEMLRSDGRALMAEVRAAAASADAARLGRAAHSLKGMISNFCAAEAHSAALELEKMGKSGAVDGAPAAADRLAARLESLIAELDAFVKARC